MAADTYWERQYERENQEILDAIAEVAAKGSVRTWPITGPAADTWNPDGYRMLRGNGPVRKVTQQLNA